MLEMQKTIRLEFENNALMMLICGQYNHHLARFEQALDVRMDSFGNQVNISGFKDNVEKASKTFTTLYKQLSLQDKEGKISTTFIDDMLRQTENGEDMQFAQIDKSLFATTWEKKIFPRTVGQSQYFKRLENNEVVFALGPAGSGKTYMAVAWAVDCLKKKLVDRIILSRPAIEAGERLGFLPGDMKEKVDPYLRPLYDALYDMMPAQKVESMLISGEIEIAPLAFMRGRTLGNAFVIIDEAQNTTPVQMKMVLTRLGPDSQMIITGDLTQIDLPAGQISGLSDAVGKLNNIQGVGIISLTENDIVRHPIISRILKAYETRQTEGL